MMMSTADAADVLGVGGEQTRKLMKRAGFEPRLEDYGQTRRYMWYIDEVLTLANMRQPGRFLVSQADLDAVEADKRKSPVNIAANKAARRAKLRGAIKELGYE